MTMTGPRYLDDDGYATVSANVIRSVDERLRRAGDTIVTADRLRAGDTIVTTDGSTFSLLAARELPDGQIRLRPWWGRGFDVPAKTRFARKVRRADTRPSS
jgi:hypothetical protein